MNYTEEQTQLILDKYAANPIPDTVEELAKQLNKSKKSIIGKLSREGVYRRSVYKTKAGLTPVTKAEIVAEIANSLDLPAYELAGLEKAPKNVLLILRKEYE
tara:strand:+ start:1434 stop:1739 length:306 start_codon:yes stop_codon:yes gene_type:complete